MHPIYIDCYCIACVAGGRRRGSGERRAREAREHRAREDPSLPKLLRSLILAPSLLFYGLPRRVTIVNH